MEHWHEEMGDEVLETPIVQVKVMPCILTMASKTACLCNNRCNCPRPSVQPGACDIPVHSLDLFSTLTSASAKLPQ